MKKYSMIILTLCWVMFIGCSSDDTNTDDEVIPDVEDKTPLDRLGQLRVEGSKLVSECGNTAQLAGMSYFWHMWEGSEYWNADAVKWLKEDWKVDVLRAAIGIDHDGGYLSNPDMAKDMLRTVVNAAIAEGIYVIIDWHSHNMYTEEAKAFFVEMAQEFGDHPNVIYEIYNEPTGNSWDDLNQTWPELKAYSEELISAIREHDPDNIIIVPTPFYDQFVHYAADDPITIDSEGNPVSNIVYGLHIYADAHRFESFNGEWARYAVEQGLPLFVSESGRTGTNFNSPGENLPNPVEYQKWLDWWGEQGISYAKWSLSNKNEDSSSLFPSAGVSGNWDYENDLREEGQWNRDHFRERNSIISSSASCN